MTVAWLVSYKECYFSVKSYSSSETRRVESFPYGMVCNSLLLSKISFFASKTT